MSTLWVEEGRVIAGVWESVISVTGTTFFSCWMISMILIFDFLFKNFNLFFCLLYQMQVFFNFYPKKFVYGKFVNEFSWIWCVIKRTCLTFVSFCICNKFTLLNSWFLTSHFCQFYLSFIFESLIVFVRLIFFLLKQCKCTHGGIWLLLLLFNYFKVNLLSLF